MDRKRALRFAFPLLLIPGILASTTFTVVNECEYTVWPGVLSNAGIGPLSPTGFALQKGESKTINPPSSWAGRLWGRTLCNKDSNGKFTCATGDCGSGKIECDGGNAAPPATLVEFTLDGSGGLDFFYDVSLVDGYNLPMLVVPQGGTGVNCTTRGCVVDLNGLCPSELKVKSSDGETVACKSPCEAFRRARYCCSGAYSTPDTCKTSSYLELLKKACPHAYIYADDKKTSRFTCAGAGAGAGADYLITFCSSSPNSSEGRQQKAIDKEKYNSIQDEKEVGSEEVFGHGYDLPDGPLASHVLITGNKDTPPTMKFARRLGFDDSSGDYEGDFRPETPSFSPGVGHSYDVPKDDEEDQGQH